MLSDFSSSSNTLSHSKQLMGRTLEQLFSDSDGENNSGSSSGRSLATHHTQQNTHYSLSTSTTVNINQHYLISYHHSNLGFVD